MQIRIGGAALLGALAGLVSVVLLTLASLVT
jgi:hypothetical protein